MVDFAIFNELSLPFENDYDLDNKFIAFLKVLSKLKESKIQNIRSHKILQDFQVCEDMSFQHYLGQCHNRNLVIRLKSLLKNQPISISTPLHEDEALDDEYVLSYCYFQGIETQGIHYAYLFNTICVSFQSSRDWENSDIKVDFQYICSHSEEDFNLPGTVKNCSSEAHVEFHKEFLIDMMTSVALEIEKGTFWENKERFFSTVVFCDEMEECILKAPNSLFNNLIKKLIAIEEGKKKITDYDCSGEGETVQDDPTLRNQRRATLPDGNVEFFYPHVKSFQDDYRLHFLERGEKVYLGYFGPHLKTKRDR